MSSTDITNMVNSCDAVYVRNGTHFLIATRTKEVFELWDIRESGYDAPSDIVDSIWLIDSILISMNDSEISFYTQEVL